MRTIAKQIAAMFICLIAMLSVFSTIAYADWTGSFGGAGGSGTVGGGFWSQQMQGIRITIMTPDGQPAFFFGDGDPYVEYLDILYTDKNTTGITAMFGSSKGIEAVSPGHNTYDKLGAGDKGNLVYVNGQPNDNVMGNGNYAARAGTEACIVSFEWYNQWLDEGRWVAVSPTGDNSIRSSFNSIANTSAYFSCLLLFVSIFYPFAKLIRSTTDHFLKILIKTCYVCIADFVGDRVDRFIRLVKNIFCVFDARKYLFLLESHIVSPFHDAIDLLLVQKQIMPDFIESFETVFSVQGDDCV